MLKRVGPPSVPSAGRRDLGDLGDGPANEPEGSGEAPYHRHRYGDFGDPVDGLDMEPDDWL